ncbi:hypothetical protein Bbelb_201190, partial [Branchiostoma belcheri]
MRRDEERDRNGVTISAVEPITRQQTGGPLSVTLTVNSRAALTLTGVGTRYFTVAVLTVSTAVKRDLAVKKIVYRPKCCRKAHSFSARKQNTPSAILGVNIALGKPSFQTSTRTTSETAGRAVDGNTDGFAQPGSCTHTADGGETDPSWWVDLGQWYRVGRVTIFNRQDCCQEQLNPFNIHIGDSDQVSTNPKCGGDHKINVTQPSISVSCQGMRGRYVGVRLPGPYRTLTFCEFQVFLGCPDEYVYYQRNQLCYKAFNDRTTYNDAVSRCSSDGGTLAMPRDTTTNEFLIDLKNSVDNKGSFRFGLTDDHQEGDWMWDDNVPLGKFSSWGPGEPNNSGNEDCAEYNPEGGPKQNTWNDGPCTRADRMFICQVSLSVEQIYQQQHASVIASAMTVGDSRVKNALAAKVQRERALRRKSTGTVTNHALVEGVLTTVM